MAVTKERLQKAVTVVRDATEEFVQLGYFKQGVLNRLDKWIKGLPDEKVALAQAIIEMAQKEHTGSGADINGVALDEQSRASLESLVLHYAEEEPGLFPEGSVASVRRKLARHGGPRYRGTWP